MTNFTEINGKLRCHRPTIFITELEVENLQALWINQATLVHYRATEAEPFVQAALNSEPTAWDLVASIESYRTKHPK